MHTNYIQTHTHMFLVFSPSPRLTSRQSKKKITSHTHILLLPITCTIIIVVGKLLLPMAQHYFETNNNSIWLDLQIPILFT